MMKLIVSAVLLVFVAGCSTTDEKVSELRTGVWRAAIEIQGQQLPFNLEVEKDDANGYDVYIRNAGEKLLLDDVKVVGDSVDIPLHIFDANIKVVNSGDSLKGEFIKNYEKDYRIPFTAVHGQAYRFPKGDNPDDTISYTGKYEVLFIDEQDTTRAIGVFNQIKDSVTGTFLTPTGDYRYLQGNVANGRLQLSTFDGNHAYLFTAGKNADGSLSGEFFSGKSHMEFWTAYKNENAKLPDPESLTYLKKGYDKIEFTFPDPDGKQVSLSDEKYKGKVVILQMFGTWCPNCMDETKFLAPWYDQNKDRGVEVIGLAYERKDDFSYASKRVKMMIEKFGVNYPFVIAGTNDKEKAAQTLPMLNKVVAFPTTIFIGRDGKVKTIHTGFSGPGTGIYYDQFVQHFNEVVNELLSDDLTSLSTK